MSIVRRIARPLLAASFIESGADAVLHPMPRAEAAAPVVTWVARPLGLPEDPELFVRATGVVQVGAGALLAIGRLPRLSAVALAVSVLPGIVTEHAFWVEKDPLERRARRRGLLTGLSLLGGALLAAVDTQGQPGLLWRGRHAVGHAQRNAQQVELRARGGARRADRALRRAARSAAKDARTAVRLD